MQSRFHWIFRVLAGVATALLVGQAHAQHAHCSYGWQDSSCVTPVYRAAQTPPTCSTDPGWTTVAAAQWIGSRFSAPQCGCQAPPSCGAGYVETVAPTWNGASWIGMSCEQPAPRQPDGGTTCLNAASSGNLMVQSVWVPNRRYVDASQFTQYVPFFQVTSNGGYQNWQWPTYTLGEYQGNYVQAAVGYLQLPRTTQNTNTWYAATYTGPNFINDVGDNYNGYITMCSIDVNGNLAGIVQMPAAPSTSLDE